MNTIHDPLSIDLRRQTAQLLTRIPSESIYNASLSNISSNRDLLAALSQLLTIPALTSSIATLFRPVLFDLCARWLEGDENTVDQLVAICMLLEVHEELFSILYTLLLKPAFKNGPLAFITSESLKSLDATRLHRLLLAYYRVLQGNRELPNHLYWSLSPLSAIIWSCDVDSGARLLAIRCYALQSGMGESEREKLEQKIFGEPCSVDCPLDFGQNDDGFPASVDGWIMPVIEMKRIQEAREALVAEPQDYYSVEDDSGAPLCATDLSPLVVNVHGVLLLRSGRPDTTQIATVVPTPTAIKALQTIALHISLRLPVLLTSPPSSQKSIFLSHLAHVLFPGAKNHIISIHLADTSLDPRSLLGSYVSSQTQPGTFEWKEGVLVRAMREGKWVVFKDIDRGSNEVLGVLKPLIESLGLGKWIGGRASLEIPGRGRVIAANDFAIFATRSIAPSRTGAFPSPVFFGAHKLYEVTIPSPSPQELRSIIDVRFPRLAGNAAGGIIRMWEAVKALGSTASIREVGLRELDKFCIRVEKLLPTSHAPMDVDPTAGEAIPLPSVFTNPTLREDIFLDARDVFLGAGTLTATARTHMDAVAQTIAEHLGLDSTRRDWLLTRWTPEFNAEKDANGRVVAIRLGRTRLAAKEAKPEISPPKPRPFAMHRPAVLLLSRLATTVALAEPVLLTGETGTGKTSAITHLAYLLRRPLISLNLSHQTESTDLIGGFKPVDAQIPASALQERFLELFGTTFSRRKNEKFEGEVRKAVSQRNWKRTIGLWKESTRLAKERMEARRKEEATELDDTSTPRKRRKVDTSASGASEAKWAAFERDVNEFEVQHVRGKSKFAFDFVEGPLVKALRSGSWVLLDEINLASPETLECISGLLHSPTASITLTEQGSLEPVPRHPDFRLFACMNPATDVGKKDLPPNIRSRFTEIDVPPPDADRETLLSIVSQYIGSSAVGDKAAIMNVAEFYSAVKAQAESRQIADGSNHKPHYGMRTLTRALTFAADIAPSFGLRRGIWEGCLMAFTMVLDSQSAELVQNLAYKHLLAGVRNPRSTLAKEPTPPQPLENFVKFGPFYLEKGPLSIETVDDYIMTPSVETKLIDLSRIILTRQFPVLIEGPTSSGKTSSVEYLAKRTGHRFIRINNHEHTDIQEYLGSYVPDPATGKLVFKDGLLVRALRNGDWIVLDELNLAPTDVLEALNRLLDDNRELVVPETQEIIKPHPNFMLFATQNPPGLYAGRKILSRAFRNRFLEVHFDDVPQAELETILCQRCSIAPTYGKKIVAVFHELQNRRQAGRVFESKHGFATLRDLFRWAGRDAVGYQELAENGYMLLAERARRDDDKAAVKEVIESVMGVKINEHAVYNLQNPSIDFAAFLGCSIPSSPGLIWTAAMQRLFVLVGRALRFNEPVLLVGETGSGKTSVCQVFAETTSKRLHGLNCHQNTETADLIGGLRPVRNRSTMEAEVVREAGAVLEKEGINISIVDVESLEEALKTILHPSNTLSPQSRSELEKLKDKIVRSRSIFEWRDGPLVEAMRNGDVFLLDEISLTDDSVLERLNSVLEPARTIVLAEKGGDDLENPTIQADESFKLVATMNPGGDYGKKELSPALRNRFTEIWVPAVDERTDLQLIVSHMWKHDAFKSYTSGLLDFVEWLCTRVGDKSLMNLRDILAWVTFSNSTYECRVEDHMPTNEIFHHAAHMTFLDGLGSLPQLAGYSREALRKLREDATSKLLHIAPMDNHPSAAFVPAHDPSKFIQLGSFAISRGTRASLPQSFNFGAPTTQDNAMRVVRACQVLKPILLEGSPGVGKTSLITALAKISGHELHRINLSDQTDLMDLFGSDLPVEGGGPGEFAWKDAEFLRALQHGHWVLLDEMNLAPQAVLEGLNAVLDHRGSVYIPELGRSFTRHPEFRIFAAQNPLSQGGGRKGLPKSFVNRFTKVYIEELTPGDLLLVCQHLFPSINADVLQAMISFNTTLNESITVKRMFAQQGYPWEFNLRDVIRWATLLSTSGVGQDPYEYLHTVYLHRFRTLEDRQRASALFDHIFQRSSAHSNRNPHISITGTYLQVGHFRSHRKPVATSARPTRLLKKQLSALESAGHCVSNSWLAIITGGRNSGKTDVVRALADATGNCLREVSINSATDTMDILGGFEQIDARGRLLSVVREVLALIDRHARTSEGTTGVQSGDHLVLRQALEDPSGSISSPYLLEVTSRVLNEVSGDNMHRSGAIEEVQSKIASLTASFNLPGQFEWVDGPLLRAMEKGDWLLLDGANLCNPSVLDRLNSLCETDGFLTLSEKGYVEGQVQIVVPHPDFRLFMTVDPYYGELSRAMRNRGIEISLVLDPISDDTSILQDHDRMPLQLTRAAGSPPLFEAVRRGIFVTKAPSSAMTVTSGRAFEQDSALSSLVDQALILIPEEPDSTTSEAFSQFFIRAMVPAYVPYWKSFLAWVTMERKPSGSGPQALLQALPDLPVLTRVRDNYAAIRGVPPAFVSAQPVDFYMLGPPSADSRLTYGTDSPHKTLLTFLDLFVALTLDNEVDGKGPPSGVKNRFDSARRSERVLSAIGAVLGAAKAICYILLKSMNAGDWEHSTADLGLALKLLKFSQHLRKGIRETYLDYSIIQSVSGWIVDALEESQPCFASLADCASSLRDIVSPTTGLGLVDIWTTFLSIKPSHASSEARRLELLVSGLKGNSKGPELRRQVFNMMAVHTFSPRSGDQISSEHLEQLEQQLKHRLDNGDTGTAEKIISPVEPSSVIAELGLLCLGGKLADPAVSEALLNQIEEVVQLACRAPSNPLLRLVTYQHLLWAIKADAPDGSDSEKALFPILNTLKMQWMEDICAVEIAEGPSILLQPTQLNSVLSICDRIQQPLSSLEEYEGHVNRHKRLALLAREHVLPRMVQLEEVLTQSVLTILSCFAASIEDFHVITGYQTGTPSIHRILSLTDTTSNDALRRASRALLLPVSQRSNGKTRSRRDAIADLGLLSVAIYRLAVDLYVPDTPLDPATVQSCKHQFWRQEERNTSLQIDLHSQLEAMTSGNTDNAVVDYLKGHNGQIAQDLADAPVIPARGDVSRLHMFWSEISQFLTQVINPSKLDSLIVLLEKGDDSAMRQEPMIQQSIIGFCQRLETVYSEYADLCTPVRFALLHLRIGLHLVRHSAVSADQTHINEFASALVAFPSVRSSTMVRAASQSETAQSISPFQYVLLNISSLVLEASIDIEVDIDVVETAYEQALRLWLIDRAKEAEAEAASQSLYRSTQIGHTAISDAELEEQEFLALFPSFEESLESDGQSSSKNSTSSSGLLVQSADMQRLVGLHHALLPLLDDPPFNHLSEFFALRKSAVTMIIEAKLEHLTDSIDRESIPFQLSTLHSRLSALQVESDPKDRTYNFYTDPNARQAKKATAVLEDLRKRLDALIQEWPDQMVLRHLLSRCEDVLALDLNSPVAKILSSLELLLVHTDDWEIYANRSNNLKTERGALIDLIVGWRRLELFCWQGLLESQAQSFESGGGTDWWFRLYNASIRGALDASYREQRDEGGTLTAYIDTLVPLLDDFIRASPLGQFHARMRLLQTFEIYCIALIRKRSGHERLAMMRVQRVLHSTHAFYSMFSTQLSKLLLDQRAVLETEIRGFIKLASWRDINVQALKASAQRTHHHLYKIIRKFRDILRQPISNHLTIQLAGSPECDALQLGALSTGEMEAPYTIPDTDNVTVPAHLRNLQGTFSKFSMLISTRISPFIRSRSAHPVDDLSVDIIVTTRKLSAISIPNSLTVERQQKQQKALLVRKRKAWSDLLKELKRAGFAANVIPDTLRQQQDSRWLREQPLMPPSPVSTEKGESYFTRLQGSLPDLRSSVPTHHSDLSTRELQRGVMFLESAYGMAVQSRAQLATFLVGHNKLKWTLHRFKMFDSSRKVISFGIEVLEQVSRLWDLLCRLISALKETLGEIETLEPASALSSVIDQTRQTFATSKSLKARLGVVLNDMKLSSPPVLLECEHNVVLEISQHIKDTTTFLQHSAEIHTPFRHLFSPTHEWLESQQIPSFLPQSHASSTESSVDAVIDACLIGVQTMLARCPEVSDDAEDAEEEERDKYIREDINVVRSITTSLNIHNIQQRLDATLREFASRGEIIVDQLHRILPFLEHYVEVAQCQLTSHSQWTTALFKLVYVLSSVMQTVAKQGFCQPPIGDDNGAEGETTDVSGGMGLGEGSGTENVSKEIEDESQVEGLQNDEPEGEAPERQKDDDDNAIEMSEDFGGAMEDMPDTGSEDENDSQDGESDVEPDEKMADLDASDPDAVDEKLWGDEGSDEKDKSEQKIDEDRSKESGENQEDDIVAKEGKQQSESKKESAEGAKDEEQPPANAEDETAPEEDTQNDDVDEDHPDANGMPMDDHVPDANALELPDDLDLGLNEDQPESMDVDEDLGEADDMEDAEAEEFDDGPTDDPKNDEPQSQDADHPEEDASGMQHAQQEEGDEEIPDENAVEGAVAQPDLTAGDDLTASNDSKDAGDGKTSQTGEGGTSGATGETAPQEKKDGEDSSKAPDADMPLPDASQSAEDQDAGAAPTGSQQGHQSSPLDSQLSNNPLRSLGDALKEIRERFDQILDSEQSDAPREKPGTAPESSQVEYLHPDDADHDMEALGPAGDEQVAKLNQLNIMDGENDAEMAMDVDVDPPSGHEQHETPSNPRVPSQVELTARQDLPTETEGAIKHDGPSSSQLAIPPDLTAPKAKSEAEDHDVEVELRRWQVDDLPDDNAEHMWHLYESLTHDLAYALCEQLRLILEPTLATRLKGDYRTGKRLNMKKIISYIASDYTKDKIWLRRTRPSQREYQVLIALDDSRSMAESHSVHLAYETLALVSKALNRLEAGDIGIAKFGETVDILHGFDEGPFSDQAGVQVMKAFKFNQKATNVLTLVDTSLRVLERARERRSMSSSSAADLWQLEIIISDGMCQDHEALRAVIRKAEEHRVMIVFIIIDSLHSAPKPGSTTTTTTTTASVTPTGHHQGSILSMEKAEFKNGELHLQRYLDSFPFEYYVVLRNVEALPEVLSGTLKQFFERISEE